MDIMKVLFLRFLVLFLRFLQSFRMNYSTIIPSEFDLYIYNIILISLRLREECNDLQRKSRTDGSDTYLRQSSMKQIGQ